jgi:hypothetical protein
LKAEEFIVIDQVIQQLLSIMAAFHYDWGTGIVTAVALPLPVTIGLIVRKFSKAVVKYLGDGAIFTISRIVFRRLSASLTLARYANLALAGTSPVQRPMCL